MLVRHLSEMRDLGGSFDSHLTLDRAKRSFERIVRRPSVRKNLNSWQARRGFSRYPYHCLNGAISTVQNCAEARGAASAFMSGLQAVSG
jgi:hypothetical protein